MKKNYQTPEFEILELECVVRVSNVGAPSIDMDDNAHDNEGQWLDSWNVEK